MPRPFPSAPSSTDDAWPRLAPQDVGVADSAPFCAAGRVEGRCGGRPTFPGSRVEPRHVHGRFWGGESLAVLMDDHPHVPLPLLRWALLHGHLLLTPEERAGLHPHGAP